MLFSFTSFQLNTQLQKQPRIKIDHIFQNCERSEITDNGVKFIDESF